MLLEHATYPPPVHDVFIGGVVPMEVSQAEVEGIRLEYYRGVMFLDGCQIVVYGRSDINCQVRASRLLHALARKKCDV